MGKLKLSSDLFLEVNELNRLVYFLKPDGYIKMLKSLVSSYGIVRNESMDSFKVRGVLNSNSQIIVDAGLAYDPDFNSIELKSAQTIDISTSTTPKWVVLSYATSNLEVGTVSIKDEGTLTGTGTKFTEVLRGRTKFPTKVKFQSTKNVDDYEVLQVNSDTAAVLSGSFTPEEGISYAVVGCFTPGFLPSDDNKLIYEYDSCSISVVEADERPTLEANQFLLASVTIAGAGLDIVDYRNEHIFNGNSSSEQSRISTNPIMSLLSVTNLQNGFIQMGIEKGYTITNYNVTEENDVPVVNIVAGSCNFLGAGTIPDNLFNGWILVNRTNMKTVGITSNTNKNLYVPTLGSDFLEVGSNELVVVPAFPIVETKITVNDVPYYFRQTHDNVQEYITVPVVSGNNVVTLSYRMLNETYSTVFGNFSISNYTNVDGETVSLIDSSFNVSI